MKDRLLVIIGVSVIFLLSASLLSAQDDINKLGSCKYCGMSLEKYAHSRMLITYDDNTETGVCSLHCAAVDLAINLDKAPKSIQVGDYNTKKLIDAEQANWVIGGDKPGVMTKRGKWAFEKKTDAETFIKTYGGTAASFNDAIKAAYEDIYADTKMIREKRKMKKMQMQMPDKKQ
jgi:copper chaperone NosL